MHGYFSLVTGAGQERGVIRIIEMKIWHWELWTGFESLELQTVFFMKKQLCFGAHMSKSGTKLRKATFSTSSWNPALFWHIWLEALKISGDSVLGTFLAKCFTVNFPSRGSDKPFFLLLASTECWQMRTGADQEQYYECPKRARTERPVQFCYVPSHTVEAQYILIEWMNVVFEYGEGTCLGTPRNKQDHFGGENSSCLKRMEFGATVIYA